MAESETVSISKKEVRGLQVNSWVSAVLLGGTGVALARAIVPDAGIYIYLPVGFILMAVPMYTFLRLERRRRDLPFLTAPRFSAAVLLGALVAAAVAFGLERLFLSS
jgi:hypothetical protein